MKELPTRPCPMCETALRLPADVIEVVAPGTEDELKERDEAALPKKRAARKKYVRKPGEEVSMSRKMRYLEEQLMKASTRNPKSANYNGVSVLTAMSEGAEGFDDDDVAEIVATGGLQVTKSVVL